MFKTFFWALVVFTGILAIPQLMAQTSSQTPEILKIVISSGINPGTADYISRAITETKTRGGQALLIELDTPGGLLESTRSIVKEILNADVPIIVYVAPRGARSGSAGVFITMAAHVAAMSPGTNIGAAHPVTGAGKDPEESGGEHLAKKIENDTTAFIETIANQRSRNIAWAKDAVLKSVSVTEIKALELGVIDLIATDTTDLLNQIDGRVIQLPTRKVTLKTKESKISPVKMSLKQYLVDLFSNPNIIYFLMMIAALGIYLELSNPGAILPGVAAGISVILILLTAQTIPFNIAGVLLIVLGVVLFILEVYVTSYGLLAIGGIVAFGFGSLLLFDSSEAFGFFGVSHTLIASTLVMVTAVVGTTAYVVSRAQLNPVTTGKEGLIGQVVEVIQDINPDGKVLVEGEYWYAHSNVAILKGGRAKIVQAKGMHLEVEPVVRNDNA